MRRSSSASLVPLSQNSRQFIAATTLPPPLLLSPPLGSSRRIAQGQPTELRPACLQSKTLLRQEQRQNRMQRTSSDNVNRCASRLLSVHFHQWTDRQCTRLEASWLLSYPGTVRIASATCAINAPYKSMALSLSHPSPPPFSVQRSSWVTFFRPFVPEVQMRGCFQVPLLR